jgi:protein-disulfide isomerase
MATTQSPEPSVAEPVGRDVGIARGSEDAPVRVEEYMDYQCPYCAMVARLTVPGIIERYVETGQVRYILYDFPVHPGENSYLAAEAARCAGDQGAYWRMHDVLLGRLSEWSQEGNPTGRFREYAEQLGLDMDAYRTCMSERRHRDVVLASRRRGEQQGINSTPTFVINGEQRISGAIGFDRLAALIEEHKGGQ